MAVGDEIVVVVGDEIVAAGGVDQVAEKRATKMGNREKRRHQILEQGMRGVFVLMRWDPLVRIAVAMSK